VGTVVGIVITVLVIAFVVLFILSKSLNSISKSIQKMQGRNRCVACKRRLKAVSGVYATTCSKCGTAQPTDFERAIAKSKLSMLAGERGLMIGPAKSGEVRGQLILTSRRLHFAPRGRGARASEFALESIRKVINFSDAAGFAIELESGSRTKFSGGKKSQWYEKVLAAANDPAIKELRLKKAGTVPTASAPHAPSTDKSDAPSKQLGVADEIAKLVALRDSGALTAEEFDRQKAKLLM